MLSNRIGNIDFHGFLSTAWPWPYAPSGLPPLTIQMNRADPFDQLDGCGDGRVTVADGGLVEKIYNLWDRNPVSIKHSYLASNGSKDKPSVPTRTSY
jgi:3',5'-cyclic-AMP phosphodiesterase